MSCSCEKRYQALYCFSVLQATESWAGPGNKADTFLLWLICHSQIPESRKALSQREAELLGSSEQCRVVLEEQIADLRRQLSTAEQDLCVTKEDVRSLHQQLRDKVKGGREEERGGRWGWEEGGDGRKV